jgi:Raf kinase inhibitor-like YbhB/YbcL family protein
VNIKPIAAKGAFAGALSVCLLGVGGGYARGDTDLTFTSPAFADGAPIPVQYACPEVGGQDIPPPLTWSAPPGEGSGLALTMDDLDAVGGNGFVHWVVIGIPPGPGSSASGQTPNGLVEPNDNGDHGYRGPCPPAGTGRHRYQFTLYSVPDLAGLTPRLGAGGSQAAAAIAQASTASATFVGTYGPL